MIHNLMNVLPKFPDAIKQTIRNVVLLYMYCTVTVIVCVYVLLCRNVQKNKNAR